ncbi:MAG: hypothetical protein M1816_006976 [Peltula sp. TS41687]|nr:MAG: hypothetical protein M1816_006976 [Peltula sp. TS41687]
MASHQSQIAQSVRSAAPPSGMPTRTEVKKSTHPMPQSLIPASRSRERPGANKEKSSTTTSTEAYSRAPVSEVATLPRRLPSVAKPIITPQNWPATLSLRSASEVALSARDKPTLVVVGSSRNNGSNERMPGHTLRRKPSTINQYAQATCGQKSQASMPRPPIVTAPPSFGGITVASDEHHRSGSEPCMTLGQGMNEPRFSPVRKVRADTESPHANWTSTGEPPLTLPDNGRSHDLPLPTPLYVTRSTSSPSTRHSESPGPWSRTSTPTSMSSHSPGLSIPAKWAPRPRQMGPAQRRPPVTWQGPRSVPMGDVSGRVDSLGLTSLRESLTSSSSGSTIKASERKEVVENNDPDKVKRKGLPLSPPTPPLRKSSIKPPRSRARLAPDGEKSSLLEPSRIAQPLVSSQTSASLPTVAKKVMGSPISRELPPPRPSREGAPNLSDPNGTSIPIIQSNLTGLPFSAHRRRGSIETSVSSFTASKRMPTNASMPSFRHKRRGSEAAQDEPSQSLDRLQSGAGAVPPASISPVSKSLPSADPKPRKRDQSPSQTSTHRAKSRFGFFTRRTRTEPEVEDTEKPKKPAKKGPAAGTGHEGYGRYTLRGRTGSSSSIAGSVGRSPSASTSGSGAQPGLSRVDSVSSKGEQKLDEFFLDRLDPVVIVGNGSVESHLSTAEVAVIGGSQTSLVRRSSIDSQATDTTEFSNFSKAASEISGMGRVAQEKFGEGFSQSSPSRSPEGGVVQEQIYPPSASFPQIYQLSASEGSNRVLPPLSTDSVQLSRSVEPPLTQSASTIPSTAGSDPMVEDVSEGTEGIGFRSKLGAKSAVSPSKWKPLHRPPIAPELPTLTAVPVQVAPRQPARPLPHYAILDSTELEGSQDLETMMKEVDQFSDTDDEKASLDVDETRKYTPSVLLPDPPVIPSGFRNPRAPSPKVMLRRPESLLSPPPEPVKEALGPKPSRLQQVGRIPRVVSSRVRIPPTQSFSRPFSSLRPVVALAAVSAQTKEGENAEVTQPVSEDEEQTLKQRPIDAGFRKSKSYSSLNITGYHNPLNSNEFLTFPQGRKGSEVSCSSSSGLGSVAAHTAIISPPDSGPGEDEVWKEYDDLIDHVFSPSMELTSRSSYGFSLPTDVPFATSTVNQSRHSISLETDQPSPRAKPTAQVKSSPDLPAVLPIPLDTICKPNPADKLATPVSFTDLYAEYGERNLTAVIPASSNLDASKEDRPNPAPESSIHMQGEDSEASKKTDLVGFSSKEANGLDSEMNLRFGALMTSRWLSFGRVLFSPAHNEINQTSGGNRQERLLILDGLGNDDWSFYCALTYPHATVYNLSPSPKSSTISNKKRESGAMQSPPNHRQIHQASFAHPFPFPKGFFAVVVFRFPVASSEAAYRNAISECKRVLRPGGYLEISALDQDLMNMGNRARKAVRMLKVRMQQADSSVSLKPTSDNILRLLGRRGFENVNRCMLGVPVAGNVARSRETSVDESSLSLSELLRDQSQEGDEGITKMVARVGRWWYTRCHEMITLPDGGLTQSLWNDRALLRECEKGKTSFKLLICYAQKPLAPRRRTVSV